MTHNLAPHTSGDWWNGLTIPQILRKGPETGAVYSPIDLTGATVTMQVRARPGDATALLDLRSDGDNPAIAITEPHGPIVVAGRVIDLPSRVYVYAVEVRFPATGPKEYLAGEWPVTQDTARRTY